MANKTPGTARGMRDLLPEDMRRRQYIESIMIETFERFGFEPLGTPAIERADTLLGKYGPDAERLIYRAGIGREQDLALRYDLTVPTARVAASYDQLPRPFKRYQIAPVWRGERPQRGRYREFTQADVDIIGSQSLLADAEIITIVVQVLEALDFPDTLTKINNRKLLKGIGRFAGAPAGMLPGLFRAIDKLDKIGFAGVRQELRSVGLPGELLNRQRQAVERWIRGTADRATLRSSFVSALADDAPAGFEERAIPAFLAALDDASFGSGDLAILPEQRRAAMDVSLAALRRELPVEELIDDRVSDRLLELLQLRGESRMLLADLESRLDDPEASQGIAELRQVLDALDATGVPPSRYCVDFAMVRGLDYYTGTIFETVVEEPPIGSITGGGRYDRLLALFGPEQAAVGTSFGIDRLVDVMESLDLFPERLARPTCQLMFALLDDASALAALGLSAQLRKASIRTDLSFEPGPVGDQIRLALRRGVPLIAILGPDEMADGTVSLRQLERREQITIPQDELVAKASEWLT